jgi:hypothetical protein
MFGVLAPLLLHPDLLIFFKNLKFEFKFFWNFFFIIPMMFDVCLPQNSKFEIISNLICKFVVGTGIHSFLAAHK